MRKEFLSDGVERTSSIRPFASIQCSRNCTPKRRRCRMRGCRSAPSRASSWGCSRAPSVRSAISRSASLPATARSRWPWRLPDDGRIVACDVSEEYTPVARRYWEKAGVEKKIDLRLGPAVATLDKLIADKVEPFDIAFIDADKSNYDAYYERCLQLLRPGGLILCDNMLWSGRVIDKNAHDEDTDALRALNAKAGKDERVDVALLSVGDGVLIARKR